MLLEQVSTIMSCTPPLHFPQCFYIWYDSHVIVFGSSLYRFTYQDAYFYMKDRSNTYLLHGEFSLLLIYSYYIIITVTISIIVIYTILYVSIRIHTHPMSKLIMLIQCIQVTSANRSTINTDRSWKLIGVISTGVTGVSGATCHKKHMCHSSHSMPQPIRI